jgi:hypothetical protein
VSSARDILGRLELVVCVAIAACSPSVAAMPARQRENGTWAQPTPTEWAEHVVRHAEALRKTIRWAWAARVEE